MNTKKLYLSPTRWIDEMNFISFGYWKDNVPYDVVIDENATTLFQLLYEDVPAASSHEAVYRYIEQIIDDHELSSTMTLDEFLRMLKNDMGEQK